MSADRKRVRAFGVVCGLCGAFSFGLTILHSRIEYIHDSGVLGRSGFAEALDEPQEGHVMRIEIDLTQRRVFQPRDAFFQRRMRGK